MAMSYGNVYVASISMGNDKIGALRAFKEAEEYKGPSIIIAYAPCIGHGLKGGMGFSQNEEDEAVKAGYWFDFRFDPRLKDENKNPFILDSKEPSIDLDKFIYNQMRYEYLKKKHPDIADQLFKELKKHSKEKLELYKKMAGMDKNPE
ncbi:MAG: Pyruvate synthase [Candidatus Anoxychlamydiales bacterium]|nr:Pyruvate synthase [Candidatus Anoxychlamydiales bacterium]